MRICFDCGHHKSKHKWAVELDAYTYCYACSCEKYEVIDDY